MFSFFYLRRDVPAVAYRTFVHAERLRVLFEPLGVQSGLFVVVSSLREAAYELVLVPLMKALEKLHPLQGEYHLPAI